MSIHAVPPETVTEVEAIESDALAWPERARSIIIRDPDSYRSAGEMLIGIKALRKEIDSVFNPIIAKAHDAHKAALAGKSKVETPLVTAETIIKDGIRKYTLDQERIRSEQEAIARAEALRLEEERRLAEAVELEESGDSEAASALIDAPIMAPVTQSAPPAVRVAGITTPRTWKARVVSKAELVQFVARNPTYLNVLDINHSALAQIARSMKDAARVDGVEFFEDISVSSASR